MFYTYEYYGLNNLIIPLIYSSSHILYVMLQTIMRVLRDKYRFQPG